jgi:hypothetical protein
MSEKSAFNPTWVIGFNNWPSKNNMGNWEHLKNVPVLQTLICFEDSV